MPHPACLGWTRRESDTPLVAACSLVPLCPPWGVEQREQGVSPEQEWNTKRNIWSRRGEPSPPAAGFLPWRARHRVEQQVEQGRKKLVPLRRTSGTGEQGMKLVMGGGRVRDRRGIPAARCPGRGDWSGEPDPGGAGGTPRLLLRRCSPCEIQGSILGKGQRLCVASVSDYAYRETASGRRVSAIMRGKVPAIRRLIHSPCR